MEQNIFICHSFHQIIDDFSVKGAGVCAGVHNAVTVDKHNLAGFIRNHTHGQLGISGAGEGFGKSKSDKTEIIA